MKRILLLMAISSSISLSNEWVIVKGGISPDRKFAVAVYPRQPACEKVEGPVILVDQKSQKRIGLLEEVDSTGGSWGTPTENIWCEWLAGTDLLFVNYRAGRSMYGCQIYHIHGRRAIPVNLPDVTSNPKAKIFDVLRYTSNSGSNIGILKDGTVLEERYGYSPKEGYEGEDYSKYGLEGFDYVLYLHYRFDSKGQLKLEDITARPPRNFNLQK